MLCAKSTLLMSIEPNAGDAIVTNAKAIGAVTIMNYFIPNVFLPRQATEAVLVLRHLLLISSFPSLIYCIFQVEPCVAAWDQREEQWMNSGKFTRHIFLHNLQKGIKMVYGLPSVIKIIGYSRSSIYKACGYIEQGSQTQPNQVIIKFVRHSIYSL